MDPVHDRGSMDLVHESGPWTQSKVAVHGPLVHVLSSPKKYVINCFIYLHCLKCVLVNATCEREIFKLF